MTTFTPEPDPDVAALREKLSEVTNNFEIAQEELDSIVTSMALAGDSGWISLTQGLEEGHGLTLATLKDISNLLHDMTETNPLLKRGNQIRNIYVNARGVTYDIQPRTSRPAVEKSIDDPYNWEAVFASTGRESMMKARFCDGNRFLLVRKRATGAREVIHVPLQQIGQVVVDPNDRSRIRYIQRVWTANGKQRAEWYATDQYDSKAKTQFSWNNKTQKVNRSWVMIHQAVNRPAGQTWGLPDSLAAYLWVLAYSNYLKDNAALVKAYSAIAMKVSSATKKGADAAAQRLGENQGVGGTATHGPNTQITAMSPTGSNVDFNNGRPLAAMIASSLGVSIVALLSDPGTGGSYGVAETLDPPTLLMAQDIQQQEADLYKRVLVALGANQKSSVTYPSTDRDAKYRVIQSLAQLHAQGILSRKEVRLAAITLLDIENPESGLPGPDGFNNWSDPTKTAQAEPQNDPTPRQGNSGAAGSVDQGTNNDARDNGELD